jgi:CBS domain-containing protein
MDDAPLTCTTDTEIDEVRRMMLERHARYMPVLNRRTLMGVISFYDVAKAVVESAGLREPHAEGLHPRLAGRGGGGRSACRVRCRHSQPGLKSRAAGIKKGSHREPFELAKEEAAEPLSAAHGGCARCPVPLKAGAQRWGAKAKCPCGLPRSSGCAGPCLAARTGG